MTSKRKTVVVISCYLLFWGLFVLGAYFAR